MSSSRLTAYYIIEILRKYKQDNNVLSQADILDYLERDYGLEIGRRTLYNYLTDLRLEGLITEDNQLVSNNEFTKTEKRLIMDGAMYSYHIPKNISKSIVTKLTNRLPEHEKKTFKYTAYQSAIKRTLNENIGELLDTIEEAISKKRKLKVVNGNYNLKKEFYDTVIDVISPYFITMSNGNYYLICHGDKKGNVLDNIRIDRIRRLEILDECIDPIEEVIEFGNTIEFESFIKRKVLMFSGKNQRIIFRVHEHLLKYFMDFTGFDFDFISADGDILTVSIFSNPESVYHFAISYGHMVEVVEPKELRDNLKKFGKMIYEMYKD